MKIILNERQYHKLLTEDTVGVDNFVDVLMLKHPMLKKKHKEYIKNSISSSGAQNISWDNLKVGIGGISLHNKLVLNSNLLGRESLEYIFYVIFHEIAHQYQFKKYGHEKMYGTFKNDNNILRSIDWLRSTENVADQYGMRKTRELHKLGILKSEPRRKKGAYDNFSDDMFYQYIKQLQNVIGDVENTNPERASELLFNFIINKEEIFDIKLPEQKPKTIEPKQRRETHTCPLCGNEQEKRTPPPMAKYDMDNGWLPDWCENCFYEFDDED